MEKFYVYIKLILDIINYFNSSNLCIIYSQNFKTNESITFYDLKLLNSQIHENYFIYISTMIYNDENKINDSFLGVNSNQNLIVLYLIEDELIEFMKAIPKLIKINRTSKWLIFIELSKINERLLKEAFIPFDCEVLFIPFVNDINNFTILEVYNSNNDKHLIQSFGIWSFNGTLRTNFKEKSLNFRRRKLR